MQELNPLDFPITNLYEPGMPARMASSPPGASLQQGEWQLLQNIRVGNRALKTRNGMARVGSSPAALSVDDIRTAKTINLNGTEYPICIYLASGSGSVRAASYNTTSGAWTEITAASGKYGNTRFSASSADVYDICKVTDPQSGKEYAVLSGLNQSPRVWDGTSCATHAEVVPPSSSAILTVVPTFPKFFDIKTDANTSRADSGANFASADTGSSPDHYYTLTRNTTADANPTITLTFSSAVDLSACPQLVMLYESAHLNWWESVKVQIQEGAGSPTTIWDPADSTYAKDSVTVDATNNRYAVAFSLNQVVAASRNAVDTIILTWVGKEPTATKTLLLYMVAGSGLVRGECQHAVSYLNSGSRAESIGLIYAQDKILPEVISNLGAARVDGLRIPNDSKLLYDWKVNYQNPVTAQKDAGVDTLLVYRNDIGEDSGYYTYVASVSLATPDDPFTAWSYVSGTTGSVRTYTDTTPTEDKNLSIYAPDESHLPIPTNLTSLATGSGRLFGGRFWNGSTYISEVWISQADHPFRFRQDAKFFSEGVVDETSPLSFKIPGEEFQAVASTQTEFIDVTGIYIVTDESVHALGGTTTTQLASVRRVLPHGTWYPRSVAEDRGQLFFVDSAGEVSTLGPKGHDNLSRSAVEGLMSALQGRGGYNQITGCVFKNRYYAFYDTVGSITPASIRKTKCLIWDDFARGFVLDDPAGTLTIEAWCPSKTKLYGVGNDGYLYEYEKASQTTDQGSAFTTTLTGRVLHDEMWNPIFVKRMGIVCEDGASSTWTTTRTNFKDSTTSTGTINTDVSTTQAYRWDDATPKPGMRAVGVELKWSSATYPGGKAIFSLPAEVKGTLWKGADVA